MSNRLIYIVFFVISAGLLSACVGSSTTYAPVSEISRIDRIPYSGKHRVLRGETLYSIAWRYGLDYQDLARINHIDSPYTVYLGQVIYLRKTSRPVVKTAPIIKKQTVAKKAKSKRVYKDAYHKKPSKEPAYRVRHWHWPVRGPIIRDYSLSNKGIDIGGRKGLVVKAAAPGKVVYSGNGLKSYGNLVIIKHNKLYLSAYAYNQDAYVREGDWVVAGQKIASMGANSKGRAALHFEIRYKGRPLNPKKLLSR